MLDEWLRLRALSSENRTARTYVVAEGSTVVGYYCLATGSVVRSEMPKRLRRGQNPSNMPVMLLGRLAVDRAYHGRGIGSGMLKDACLRTLDAAEIVGCRAILVHAIDNRALAFYVKNDFIEFPAGSSTLFLPLEMISRACS